MLLELPLYLGAHLNSIMQPCAAPPHRAQKTCGERVWNKDESLRLFDDDVRQLRTPGPLCMDYIRHMHKFKHYCAWTLSGGRQRVFPPSQPGLDHSFRLSLPALLNLLFLCFVSTSSFSSSSSFRSSHSHLIYLLQCLFFFFL